MLEELNLLEMRAILGGSSAFCDDMQRMANEASERKGTKKAWSKKDWDNWAEAYEKYCMS